MKLLKCWPALVVLNLIGCGGGGSSAPAPASPPPPTALSGQFKLANAAGLTYMTPSQDGITDVSGTFLYGAGESVEFSVGGVVIGSARGQPILTPVDLVPGGSADAEEVQNIARFLMLLDQNGDAGDGITISSGVREVAQTWQQVDFRASDLEAELVTVTSDVASVDSRPAVLPGPAAANSLIVSNVHCAMSGFFQGTLSGERDLDFVLIMNPANGLVSAYYPSASADFESTVAVSVDNVRTFSAPATDGSGDNLEGRFDSYDELSGVWTIGMQSGQFTASRRLPDPSASFRFSGRFYRKTVGTQLTGPLVINVDEQGNVSVDSRDMNFSRDFTAQGTYIDNEFSYDYGDGHKHTGTTDPALHVAGRGTQADGSPRPWFAQGCRLN
jgi:hypothetical protein